MRKWRLRDTSDPYNFLQNSHYIIQGVPDVSYQPHMIYGEFFYAWF